MQEINDDASSTKAMETEPQAWRIMIHDSVWSPGQETITSAMLIQNLWQKVSQDNVLIAM